MRRAVLSFTCLAFAAAYFLAGCGPKPRSAQGLLDTPESHYHQGMRKLEAGDLEAAQSQFDDALHLDAKYAPAWAGLSLVHATRAAEIPDRKSEARKDAVKAAEKALDKAVDLGKKEARVWIAHIRVPALLQEDEDWIENSRKGWKKAVDLDPRSDEAYYWMGLAYRQALDFRSSEEMLRAALDLDGHWSEEAGSALQQVHRIVQAQPGTRHGRQIALVDRISRADLAVLYIEELNVVERLQRKEAASAGPEVRFTAPPDPRAYPEGNPAEAAAISDIEGHWAQSMIQDFVGAGLFEVMADHRFGPDEPVTRIEFAGTVQRLLYLATGDETLFSRYLGEQESHLRDLRTDHPYYGAAALCVERNIMQLDKITGDFHPKGNVSGADAALIIRDLKNALKW